MNWLRRCWYDRPPPLATLCHDDWRSPLWSVRRNADPVPARPVATTPRTCCEWKFDRLVVTVSAVQAGKQSVRRRAYASRYRGCRAICDWWTTTTTWRLDRKTSRRAARRRGPVRTVTDVANGVLSLVLSTMFHHNLQRNSRDRQRWCRHLRPDTDHDTRVAWSVDLHAADVRAATLSNTLCYDEAKASWMAAVHHRARLTKRSILSPVSHVRYWKSMLGVQRRSELNEGDRRRLNRLNVFSFHLV